MISSMHNILGVMWNVAFGYSIVWTGSHSPSSNISSVCSVDGPFPLLACCLYFPNFLEELSHVFQLLLNHIPVVCNIVKSSARQSWTIRAIISPSSSMIVYSGSVLCAFIFLRAPPIYGVGLLFPLGSCELGLVWSLALPQPIFVVLWLVAYSPFSPSGSLSSMCLRLFVLFLSGPSFISWALGFFEAVFLPSLPLLLLFFLASPG
jgi:hypothetical protein